MKLATHTPSMTMGKLLVKEAFEIGDEAMVVEVIRDRMYSVPIRTICQEVSSNGRDAHRELGNADVPIEIHLPTLLDMRFWVRDFGIGVDPERMANVFIKYGKSTKRDSDDQTGGFGLGAKSPFSYQDTFQIETYIPEADGKVYLRRYVAIIEESRIGALYEVSEKPEPTDEPRGTKIILTCKPNEESQFASWLEKITRYWDVRPNVIGGEGDFKWEEDETYFEGDRWAAMKYGSRCALVDKIPYPLDPTAIKAGLDADDPIRILFDLAFRLEFDTGEVIVSPNREVLNYRDDTLLAIHTRLRSMAAGMRKAAMDAIAAAPTLWEANRKLLDLPDVARKLVGKDAEWNGYPVTGEFVLNGAKTLVVTMKQSYRSERIQVKRETTKYFQFPDDNTPTYFYDEKYRHPSRAKLLRLFHTSYGMSEVKVRVIVFNHRAPGEETWGLQDAEDRAALDDSHGLGILLSEIKRFSTIEKWKEARSKSAGGNVVPKIKILQGGGYGSSWVDADGEYDFDGENEIVFVQLYGGDPYLNPGRIRCTNSNTIRSFQEHLETTIVGVQTPSMKKVPDHWVWAGDAIQEKFREVRDHPDADKALAYVAPPYYNRLSGLNNLRSKILTGSITIPEGGLLDRWKQASEENADLVALRSKITAVAYQANQGVVVGDSNPADVSGVLKEAVEKRMPFLKLAEKVPANYPIEEIQWYIDLKEAEAVAAKVDPEEDHLAKKAYEMAKSNGGTMSWRQVEAALELPLNNGMSAVRLAKKHTPPLQIFNK